MLNCGILGGGRTYTSWCNKIATLMTEIVTASKESMVNNASKYVWNHLLFLRLPNVFFCLAWFVKTAYWTFDRIWKVRAFMDAERSYAKKTFMVLLGEVWLSTALTQLTCNCRPDNKIIKVPVKIAVFLNNFLLGSFWKTFFLKIPNTDGY